jgi:hypothetical protein
MVPGTFFTPCEAVRFLPTESVWQPGRIFIYRRYLGKMPPCSLLLALCKVVRWSETMERNEADKVF